MKEWSRMIERSIKCPKCGSEENIVHFLRHQKESEDDEGTNANCWTILCKECGYNESYLLEDLLEEVFPEWSTLQIRIKELENQFQEMYDSVEIQNNIIEADNVEVQEVEEEVEEEYLEEEKDNVEVEHE